MKTKVEFRKKKFILQRWFDDSSLLFSHKFDENFLSGSVCRFVLFFFLGKFSEDEQTHAYTHIVLVSDKRRRSFLFSFQINHKNFLAFIRKKKLRTILRTSQHIAVLHSPCLSRCSRCSRSATTILTISFGSLLFFVVLSSSVKRWWLEHSFSFTHSSDCLSVSRH